jgi:hypothetical protein
VKPEEVFSYFFGFPCEIEQSDVLIILLSYRMLQIQVQSCFIDVRLADVFLVNKMVELDDHIPCNAYFLNIGKPKLGRIDEGFVGIGICFFLVAISFTTVSSTP